MRLATHLLSVTAILLGLVSSAEARCAQPRLHAELLTQTTEPLPVGASLLVLVTSSYEHGVGPEVARGDDETVVVRGLELVQGATRVALRSEMVGGGLVRMVPERAVPAGTYLLKGFTRALPTGETVEREISITFRGQLPPAPAAVSLTSARHTERSVGSTRWGERHEARSTFAFSQALPQGARAMVVGPSGAVVLPPGGGREAVLTSQYGGSHCGDGYVPGVQRLEVGVTLHLVIVDAYGRVVTSSASVRLR